MPPEQTPPPDYNFIMNSGPSKKGLLGGSKRSRILKVVAGGGLLLVIFAVIFSLLLGGSTSSTEKLVPIAAKQVEIIRIAGIGEKEATSLSTKNYASAIKLSMTSAHKQLMDLLAAQKRKVSAKELAVGKDTETDDALTSARQANKFDEVFIETTKQDILDYQRDLKAIHTASGSTKERAALESLYNQTRLLPVELK